MVTRKSLATYALFVALVAGAAGLVALSYGKAASGGVQIGVTRWLVVAGIAFLTGYVDTCVGGGHGTLLTPVLMLVGFPAGMVVPAILLSEIGIGLLSMFLNHRAGNLDLRYGGDHRRVLAILAVCSVIGSAVAVMAVLRLPAKYVNLYIGVVVIGVGLLLLVPRRAAKVSIPRLITLGIVAAFNKGISGGGYGPLLTSGQVLSGVCEKGAVSITPPARGLTGFLTVLLYFAASGKLECALALPLAVGSLLAIPVAVSTVKAIDPVILRRSITGVTVALGGLLVVNALR